jgi:aldose sugar dehydrogenase
LEDEPLETNYHKKELTLWLFLYIIVILTVISSAIVLEYIDQLSGKNHLAQALDPKYPEVALASPTGPILYDHHMKAEVIFRGLRYPTSMTFLGPNDILAVEKDKGTVRRIVNGTMLPQPLLDVNVATYGHRGILGIAVDSTLLKNESIDRNNITRNDLTHVFVYYTEAQTEDGEDITSGKQPLGNSLYRYDLINNTLVNPKLLLDLPATPGAIGIGGKVIVGPDNNVYVTIGDVGIDGHNTKAQNIEDGSDPDGTSGILRINKDGKSIFPGILGNKFPLNLYYAYGIWNSFGIDFDPVSGNLWDTENGLTFGDEINLVEPGFNSGYNKIDGLWLRGYPMDQTEKHIAPFHPHDLVYFGGKGAYHLPQFAWFRSVGPTGLAFFNSNKMGPQFKNDLFVGDILNGNIYDFKLNQNRSEFLLPAGPLEDRVVNSSDTLDGITFGRNFGGITDLKVSSFDGYLYVLTFDGTIYRIVSTGIGKELSER